jgi:hypothetical protein
MENQLTAHSRLQRKPFFNSNMLRKEKPGVTCATEYQVFLPTVIRTIALLGKFSSTENSAQPDEFSPGSEPPNELHLTTVSCQVLSKTVLTDQEALWIACNKLRKRLGEGEG